MEKYVFPFWKKMNEKINKSYTNSEYRLNHNLFDKIQYDVLRRLRAYWVPRFIINKLKQRGKDYGSYPLPPITPDYSRQSTYLTVSTASKITPSSGHTLHDGTELNDQQKTSVFMNYYSILDHEFTEKKLFSLIELYIKKLSKHY